MNNRPQGVTTSWYFVAVTFDAATGRVESTRIRSTTFTFDPTRIVTHRTARVRSIATNDSPLLIAAAGNRPAAGTHFNGKIENPRLYRQALGRGDRRGEAGPVSSDPLASWDFSVDIESDRITDTGPRRSTAAP